MTSRDFSFAVEHVHRLSGRPWVFVTGRLVGESILIGDRLTVWNPDGAAATTTVRSIELHTAPGMTTIAVDPPSQGSLEPGATLTSAVF